MQYLRVLDYLKLSVFLYDLSLFHLAVTLLWPLHTIYLCITMNHQSHRGSYTSLTFITIILIPVFPLSDSVSGGVHTFFSSCLTISPSILDKAELKRSAGYGRLRVLFLLRSLPNPQPPLPTLWLFSFSLPHLPSCTFTETYWENFLWSITTLMDLPYLALYSSFLCLTRRSFTFLLYSSLPPRSNSSGKLA